jgi:quinolinate synthase
MEAKKNVTTIQYFELVNTIQNHTKQCKMEIENGKCTHHRTIKLEKMDYCKNAEKLVIYILAHKEN